MTERRRPFAGRVGRQRFEESGDDAPATTLLESRQAAEPLDVLRWERMTRSAVAVLQPELIKPVSFIGHEPQFGLEHLDELRAVFG